MVQYRLSMEMDALTNLPTYEEFLRRRGSARSGLVLVAVMDRMDDVSSTFGRARTDALLGEVGSLVNIACCNAFVARLRTDGFVALFSHGPGAQEEVAATAEGLCATAAMLFSKSCRPNSEDSAACSAGRAQALTLSVSVVDAGHHGTVENAVHFAERALAHAQQRGRSGVTLAMPSLPGMDALTGLLNRRAFQEAYEQALQSEPEGFGIAFLDIDGFRRVNLARDYSYGDEVLHEVAAALQADSCTSDTARFGGEEFACLLRVPLHALDATAKSLWETAYRAMAVQRQEFAGSLDKASSAAAAPVRPALGVRLAALWIPPGGCTLEHVISVADDMLHEIGMLQEASYLTLSLSAPGAVGT